jgi:4-amino-4-deoxy-L-arabinose transferase-like glycosyltransferase
VTDLAPESKTGRSFLEAAGTHIFVALLIAFLFSLTNLPWHLDNYDQAKQAFTSFEIVQENQWLYQHTPNEKIATKPPLVSWVSAGLFAVTRSWELAWRLPSFLAAAALAFLLMRAAGKAHGNTAGVLALSAFGLNLLSPRLATLVRTDMPLALVIFLIGLKIWEKVRAAEPWQARDRLVMFLLLTAAMLIKGPILYAFLLPGIVVFQGARHDRYRKSSGWCGWWPWLASLAIFALWVVGGIVSIPGFYEQVVLKEFVGRFGERVHRAQPLYFYLPHLLHKFAPWSVLIIAFAIIAWRAEKSKLAERLPRLSPETAWLLCWTLGGLLVMSLVPSKRVDRIYPIIPPLCLLLAAQFSDLAARKSLFVRAPRWSALTLICACLAASAYAAGRVTEGFRSNQSALVAFGASIREQAAKKSWRYEIVGGREEGLLLYLRRTHFISSAGAIDRWNAGLLDALVAANADLPVLMAALPDAVASGLEATVTINGEPRRYVLLIHR